MVESDHYGGGDAVDDAGVEIDHPLLKDEAMGGDALDAGEDSKTLAEESLSEETAVDIGNHGSGIAPVERMADDRGEKIGLCEVEKLEVGAVVEMPEHIDVGEPELNGSEMAQWSLRSGYLWIGAGRNIRNHRHRAWKIRELRGE